MPQHFVNDGHERARRAVEPGIRADVEAEFAKQLEGAGFFARQKIEKTIDREVERRIRLKAPPDGVY